jgi:Mg/Co/Ni transporter MgtE
MVNRLLRHGAFPQLRKIIEKTLPADLAPVLPLLLEEDRKRVLSLLIETGKAARALLELDGSDLHEIIGSLDDATVAAICSSSAVVVGLWFQDWKIASILLVAMIVNLVVAGFAGGLVPLALQRFGFDPAVSSSIFVTTFTDVAGFASFLGLATLAMRFWPAT